MISYLLTCSDVFDERVQIELAKLNNKCQMSPLVKALQGFFSERKIMGDYSQKSYPIAFRLNHRLF